MTINPVTSPPLELLLQKARETEAVTHPINEYEPVIKILIQEKKYTGAMVREWLSNHGAGNYGQSVVSTNISRFKKKWKEEAEELAAMGAEIAVEELAELQSD